MASVPDPKQATISGSPADSVTESGGVSRPLEQRLFGGMLVRRPRWGFSLPGKLLVFVLGLGLTAAAGMCIYPFLAVTHRVDADVLVVEGWVHQYAITAAAEEFRTGSYRYLFTTGGPVIGNGGYVNDYKTSASVGADLLKKTGIPRGSIQMVPSRVSGRDRTYSSAVALRHWFEGHDLHVRSINVVSEEAHARRSRLLFEKALGSDVKVGIIAVSSPDYDAKQWWRYSDGVREVIGEGIAYIYSKLFFHPDAQQDTPND